MDQEILEAFKQCYKKQLLRHVILENESYMLTVPKVMKKLTIKYPVYWSSQAWEEATSISLSKTWNELIPPGPQIIPDDNNEEEGIEKGEIFQQLVYEERSNWKVQVND